MHDVIVSGARCAGAPTAMLLARKGYKVLLVDRATFPSDIPHGHFIHRHGPRRLAHWGLLDRIAASNCPPVTSCVMDLGDFPLIGTGISMDGVALGYGPRRSVLDTLLVDAAVEAGAELRMGFAVDGFVTEGDRITGIRGRTRSGGAPLTETATVVVGADGRHSRLARFVGAPQYETCPPVACWYFSYWSGVPDRGIGIYVRPDKAVFVFPTNDSLLGVFVGWPIDRLAAVRRDIEGHVMAAIDEIPDLSARIRAGRREERFSGASDLPNFYRKPYGPGWALVGDAGCHKDPFLALGMCDALRDVEFLVEALDDGLSGRRRLDDALRNYECRRNEASAADYRENLHLAQFKPPPEEVYRLRAALRDNATATRQFFLARQGMIPREAFFNRENLQRLGVPAPSQAGSTPFKGTNLALASGPAKAGPHVALWCLLILLLLPIGARAQARLTGSDLTGRVTDESGADTSTDFQSAFMPENNGQGRNPADPTGLPVGFDPRRERGTSSQDQRHRLVVSGLYQLPFAMQLSAIVTAASGRPFTALAGADLNGDGDGGAFPPDRARRDPANPETSVGRYSETMPSQVIADVRLSKRFTVRNGMTVMAMIEAFNLFDRANFSEVNNIFGRGAFPDEPQRDTQGRVTYGRFEQALPPRQVQLAMRVTF